MRAVPAADVVPGDIQTEREPLGRVSKEQVDEVELRHRGARQEELFCDREETVRVYVGDEVAVSGGPVF